MRRLTLLISVALAIVAVAAPATASAKRSHRTHKARVADRNHNGITDRWEHKFRVHSASADPDSDGVTNLGEFHNGTNPRVADSNGNGIPDGEDDANDDGVPDGQEQAGTIATFDGTTLTISLVSGATQQGTVNGDTELECESAAPTTITASTRDDGGDQTSTAPSTSGDDETQGDDDQGDNNDDQGDSSSCGTDALQPGTIVKEAELKLTSAGAVFHSVHLGGKAPA